MFPMMYSRNFYEERSLRKSWSGKFTTPATVPRYSAEDQPMNKKEDTKSVEPPTYEAPAIEELVSSEEMEREVHYAGVGSQNMQ